MSQGVTERFSPNQYARQLHREASGPQPTFAYIIEELRVKLASPAGKSEEERIAWSETLARAVLGYPEERRICLAVIQHELLQRRWTEWDEQQSPYATLEEAVFAEIIGLGVLEPLLKAGDAEEIQVIGTEVFVVRGGSCVHSPYRFSSVQEVERLQQNLLLYNQGRLNAKQRWAEVRLQDGVRVTLTGFGYTSEPTLTLRFYRASGLGLDVLSRPEYGTLDKRLSELLRMLLHARFNLVIIGPTNSGKTHLLKCMIAELPDEERIVTIESRLELMLRRDFPGKNIVEFETDEFDPLHNGKQAFKLALRMTPKRIVHAEIRDDDANVYVRACTRGHEGSMTTVHVTALEDVPEAIADMCMLDGRPMNPERLVKRIAEFVTQIGIELGIRGGKRRIVRLGEYEVQDGIVRFREWARYCEVNGGWVYPHSPSLRAVMRFHAAGLDNPAWGEESC